VRSGPGEARTILLLHIISARPSKQPLMIRTFLKVYMDLGSYFFLQEQIKDIIIDTRCMQIQYHRTIVIMPGFNLLVLQYYARTLKNSVDLGCVSRQRARRGAFYSRHLLSLCVHRETERAAH
jgi:hypothetical protein